MVLAFFGYAKPIKLAGALKLRVKGNVIVGCLGNRRLLWDLGWMLKCLQLRGGPIGSIRHH
jgi:hypothetical protein